MRNETIERGAFPQTLKIIFFQRSDSFIFSEADVSVLRLLCANQDTEFGKEANEALKRNHRCRGPRGVRGLADLVELLERPEVFSFDEFGAPYKIRYFEVTGVKASLCWDALRFLGFAVSI